MPNSLLPDPSRPFDVAISGAGLAGSALALSLARRGAHVALIDASNFPRDKLCGEYLSPEAWGVIDRLGLAEEVADSGFHAIRRLRITTASGRAVEAEVAGPDGRPGIGLSRSALDHRLVQHARAAGAALFESARVGGAIVEDDRVVGLRVRHAALGSFEVRAKVIVAADGRHSALVRQTGTTRQRSLWRPRLFGLKRHVTVSDPAAAEPDGTVGLHLVPGGYGGTCRVEGSLTNFCALLPESAARKHRGDLDRLAADWLGRNPVLARFWGSAEPSGPWKTVAGVRVETSSPRLAGILYAGDCQGTVDPLGGQGMTMALLGAEVLAPFVERALNASADRPLQRAYSSAWHARFDRRIRLCRLFHHALVNSSLLDFALRLRLLTPALLAACYHHTRDREAVVGR